MSPGKTDNILKCRTLRDFKDCWWNGCSEDWSPTEARKHNIGSHSFDRLEMLIYEEQSKFIWYIYIVVFEILLTKKVQSTFTSLKKSLISS